MISLLSTKLSYDSCTYLSNHLCGNSRSEHGSGPKHKYTLYPRLDGPIPTSVVTELSNVYFPSPNEYFSGGKTEIIF